jgi:hypothetical protein
MLNTQIEKTRGTPAKIIFLPTNLESLTICDLCKSSQRIFIKTGKEDREQYFFFTVLDGGVRNPNSISGRLVVGSKSPLDTSIPYFL